MTKLHRQHAQQMTIATFRQMYEDIKDKTNPDKSELLKLLDQYNIAHQILKQLNNTLTHKTTKSE